MVAAGRVGVRPRNRKFYLELVERLCAFAEHDFRSQRKLSDGATERDHIASARAQFEALGIKPKALVEAADKAPVCPPELSYLWDYFLEISLGLASNGMGPAVITWEGLKAWCELRVTPLTRWESLALVRLGQLRALVRSEATEQTKAVP